MTLGISIVASLARPCRLEVTGTETQHRPEEIRAVLLASQVVGIKALRTAADKVPLANPPRRAAQGRLIFSLRARDGCREPRKLPWLWRADRLPRYFPNLGNNTRLMLFSYIGAA